MDATTDSYDWTDEFRNGLLPTGYCLTLVKDLSVADTIDRLAAERTGERVDLDALQDRSLEIQTERAFRELGVGIADAHECTLLFEINGFLGVNPKIGTSLSAGTTMVSHSRNVNAVSRFVWWEDGELMLGFDPLVPTQREGSRAETAAPLLAEAGFDLEPHAPGDPLRFGPLASAFALGHVITGVPITADTLEDTTYDLVIAPLPRR